MTTRHGSFLVVCLVMMTLIVILSFAVLHTITAEIDVSTGNQRYLLAEEAAKTGLDHAIEQILIDYNQTTVNLRKQGGASVAVPALTYLDGAFRAPFVAINHPNSLSNGCDTNDPATMESDVRAEDYVLRPWAWWWFDCNWNWYGLTEYDGKGRYYEPGYYNVTPSPANSLTPLAPTSFVDLGAAVPERSQAIFYDEQFRRVPASGNPAADRAAARYRLRYNVGVEDISGHLLMNPIADMQMRSDIGRPVDYRNPAATDPWMTGASNALAAIAGAYGGGCFAAQLEEVFQGRGYHTNVDFDHSAAGVSGWPKTFPLMYRNHFQPYYHDSAGHLIDNSGCWESFLDGAGSPGLTTNLYFSGWSGGTNSSWVKGLMAGGETIPTWTYADGANLWYPDPTICHCLMGPQLSFQNIGYAAHGESAYLGAEAGGNSQSRPFDNFALTPFGRGQLASTYTPGQRKWYQGPTTTPFHINVMTAPPTIINNMLIGYLPPVEKTVQYTSITWSSYQGVSPDGGSIYRVIATQGLNGSLSQNQGAVYGRDLLVNTTSPPAFAPWNPPTRVDAPSTATLTTATMGAYNPPFATGIGQVISPDYYAVDTRSPLSCYPGPFMNGDSHLSQQGSDDLGAAMDEASLTNGFDFYTHAPFVSLPGGEPYAYASQFANPTNPASVAGPASAWATVSPPPTWGSSPSDFAQKSPPPVAQLHNLTYYLDLVAAMGTAIGVLRAEYTQYSLAPQWYTPDKFFGAGTGAPLSDPDPSQFVSLHDLDRVFLAEMGESISAPGTGSPAALAASHELKAYRFHGGGWPVITSDYIPRNNIYSLLQLTGAGGSWQLANADNSVTKQQRARVMEMMLNDFRMSFLGSSADYSDGIDPATGQPNPALQFMPLDFDGDGMAYCSCYPTLDNNGLPCAPAGTKPPCYFTITGNLFMGKSHFYRIFTRGEIWDNFLNRKLNGATLDSVIAVDPEGGNPMQTQMLYQRWFYNRYCANISDVQR